MNAELRCCGVPEQRLEGAPDRRLISACQSERRCLVTLDVGFGNPIVFPPSEYHGIVVLRLPPRAAAVDLDQAMNTLVAGLAKDDVAGHLWIVQPGRIRIYQPSGE